MGSFGYLTKLYYNSSTINENIYCRQLIDHIHNNIVEPDTVLTMDYRNIVRREMFPLVLRIPKLFIKSIIFISNSSFQQNHKILSKYIHKYVSSLLTDYSNIIAIGGESYMYCINSLTMYDNIYHYTNSVAIYNDVEYNDRTNKIINNLVDYNKLKKSDFVVNFNTTCLINLSSLNKNLIMILNTLILRKIIIISCDHVNFWKKCKLLNNYKLIHRKKIICYKMYYFITINLFENKFL